MDRRWAEAYAGPILSWLGGLAVVGCGIYCVLWYRPGETSFLNPDIAVTCWLYCSTLDPLWGIVTLASGVVPVIGGVLICARVRRLGGFLSIISGVATLPVGLLPVVAGFLALRERDTGPHAKTPRREGPA